MFFHQQSSAKYPAIPLLLRCGTERAYKQKKHKLSEEILSSAKQISDSFGAAPSTFTAHRVSQIACFRSITAAIFVGMSYRFPPSDSVGTAPTFPRRLSFRFSASAMFATLPSDIYFSLCRIENGW